MKKLSVIISLLALAGLMSFRARVPALFHRPDGWPRPAYNFRRHPLTEQKIALGRILFYDPVLSKDGTISCNSCHLQATAFTHVDHALSHGINGRLGTRNAPPLANLAWGRHFMMDGAVDDLDDQAIKPICNPLEMDETMTDVVRKLQSAHKYRSLFYVAWGDSLITQDAVLQSLSQFMLTFVSANSKYDRVQRGQEKFTDREERGYAIFRDKCSQCHTEPLFTNGGFENNGLAIDDSLHDIGRMKVTGNPADSLKFKVPTLRNIAQTYPYMHDGRFKTLSQVINNYIMGIQQSPTLNPLLKKGLYMNSDQKADLIGFLYTLSDTAFLHDPRYAYPGK